MPEWNPWHGCHKISDGCKNCYVYRRDAQYGKDSSMVTKTKSFYLPIEKDRSGNYKIPPGSIVFACMTSDFFVDDADVWRSECWQMIKRRKDVNFFIITKRIHRFMGCIPEDWGAGYENVSVVCTVENQKMADFRLPIFLNTPIKHKYIASEPLLGEIDMEKYLGSSIVRVIAGGESGNEARVCEYSWILSLRDQCARKGVSFHFKQTGRYFKKEGRLYIIERKYQHIQARKANIDI